MSNLIDHANRELDILGYPNLEMEALKDKLSSEEREFDPNRELRKDLIQLVQIFAEQGHSGFSASYLVAMLTKILRFQALSPLTSDPDEWVDQSLLLNGNEKGQTMHQNIRNSEAFSYDGGKTYYLVGQKKKLPYSIYMKLPKRARFWVWNNKKNWIYPIFRSVKKVVKL